MKRKGTTWATPATKKPFKKPRKTSAPIKASIAKIITAAVEKKFKDVNLGQTATTQVWAGGEIDPSATTCFTTIAQGDTGITRDGRQAVIEAIYLHGQVVFGITETSIAPLSDQTCRVVMVLDTQTNGAQLNAEDVFTTIGAGSDVNSFRQLDFQKRFKVLHDKTFTLDLHCTSEGSNAFSSGNRIKNFRMAYRWPKGLVVNYTGTTDAISTVQDNSVHLICTSTNANVFLGYQGRTRFRG